MSDQRTQPVFEKALPRVDILPFARIGLQHVARPVEPDMKSDGVAGRPGGRDFPEEPEKTGL